MFTAKTFAHGQLPDTAAALYTSPAARTAYIKNLICSNTSGAAVDVTIWKIIGANHRRIIKKSIPAGESLALTGYVLAASEAIRGEASTAAVVDYIIDGVEQS
jgi:hypothetical protein